MSIPQAPEREALSSFMDGEMEPESVDALVKACCQGIELKEEWAVYHCIGDVLRSEDMGVHSSKLARVVSARLADEPFLVASPRRPVTHSPLRRVASMAAAFAGVAVVAFVARPYWNGGDEKLADARSTSQKTAASTPGTIAANPVAPVVAPVVSSEFLAAHRQYSGGIAMQGMVGQVRNVALETRR